MRRRDFILGLSVAASLYPIAALGQQQQGRMRRVGLLFPNDQNDAFAKALISALTRGLSELGWSEGGNLRIDLRSAASEVDQVAVYAKELVELQPDVLLADSTPQTAALHCETGSIPIVFVDVSDPIGSGFIAGLPHPGGNITGFMPWEPTLAGKWLQLLIELAPSIKRIGAMFNPDSAPYVPSYYEPSIKAAAQTLGIEQVLAPVRNDNEIEAAISSLGGEQGGGLVALPDAFMIAHHAQITAQAARNKIPAIYFESYAVREGGLISYGADTQDIYYRAASYVDRILRGTKPADLPVQLPVKFNMALNLKTAQALGIEVPTATLLRADEVIE